MSKILIVEDNELKTQTNLVNGVVSREPGETGFESGRED